MNPELLACISTAISNAMRRPFTLRAATPVGGGSINEAYRLEGADGSRYFLKLNDAQHLPIFAAEAEGLNVIAATNIICVPHSVAHGTAKSRSFLVLEYLELNSRGNTALLGERLAALHRCSSDRANENPNATASLPPCRGKDRMGVEVRENHVSTPSLALPLQGGGDSGTASQFGFAHKNFIGTTPQPNGWKNSWIDFWREQRLGFQLRLAKQNGYGSQLQTLGERLIDALPAFFENHTPQPSLLHGDLWRGNHSFLADGTPVIFDPAPYYGDRECDLAMTELFGGYPADFYAAYRAAFPLDEGYAVRKDLYNLYHILNHANLFGNGYARQAEQMMLRLLAEVEG
ncbi:MAG: fructosamine kinase family protein [Nitrosomonadales bacterium]|nr:fructosamine kinase family protein [Nitrosomonadales bacterium]